jgi:hypothetical protein
MTFQEFKQTVELKELPKNVSQNLIALWYDANGDWDHAHEIVQETAGFEAIGFMHTYIEKKEIWAMRHTGIQESVKADQKSAWRRNGSCFPSIFLVKIEELIRMLSASNDGHRFIERVALSF